MANIGIFKLKTDGSYITIEELTGTSYAVDVTYQLQKIPANANLVVCVKSSTPTADEGFIVDGKVFEYTPKSDGTTLYLNSGVVKGCKLNISEK